MTVSAERETPEERVTGLVLLASQETDIRRYPTPRHLVDALADLVDPTWLRSGRLLVQWRALIAAVRIVVTLDPSDDAAAHRRMNAAANAIAWELVRPTEVMDLDVLAGALQ